jgi:hypothetical protein
MADDPVEVLRRWEDTGAVWRVLTRTASRVTIALCTCDGGEEVGRLSSDDPRLIDFLAGRTSNEPPG